MMLALSYGSVTRPSPIFDHEKTPSNVGAISEAFRRSHGVVRSVHPTHSVCAMAPLADELTADHHMDRTPLGLYSSFIKLVERDGLVLFIGCGLRPNTLMHGVEEIVGPSYLFGLEVEYTIILRGGCSIAGVTSRSISAAMSRDTIGLLLCSAGEISGRERCRSGDLCFES